MGVWRKTLRAVLWIVGVMIALPVVFYLVLLAINLRDQPPSADALAFEAALRARPRVADTDNAYVFLLGYSAARDRDPAALGVERAAWIRAMRDDRSVTWDSDPARKDGATGPGVYAEIRDFLCDPDAACDARLESQHDALSRVIASEAWALERYRQLLSYRDWQEITTRDFRNVWADISPASNARSLYLLDARLLADIGDAKGVREALEADLIFWRLALRESDSTFSRAFAESFIRRHFQWGNLILRRLPHVDQGDAIPASWRTPLSDDERAMARAFRGEWEHARRTAWEMKSPYDWTYTADPRYSPTLGDRINTRLTGPLLQPQDTANVYAAQLLRLESLTDVPYSDLPAALVRARDVAVRRTGIDAFYNLLGVNLVDVTFLADYAARVGDLEGVRRAALLAAELRSRAVPSDAVPAALALDEARNPYTGEAFQWIAARSSIGVTGAQSSTNRYTELLY